MEILFNDAGATTGVGLPGVDGTNYYVVVKQRNHIAVMTPSAQSGLTWGTASTVSTYDFTTAVSIPGDQFYGGTAAAVEVESGVWAMIAGDANGSGAVNATDYVVIKPEINTPGYKTSDVNLSGTVNATDYLKVKSNINKLSSVPN